MIHRGSCGSRTVHWTAVAFAIAIVLLSAEQLSADENPFGLPAPHDPKRPGMVMLHGGGSQGLNDQIRQEFVRLAGGREARILLIPSDQAQRGKDDDDKPIPGGETLAAYEQRLSQFPQYGRWHALRKNGQVADFQFLIPNREDDPDHAKFYALLEQATGVWLPALDQSWLPQEFANDYPRQTSRFQLALREVVARGGVVGGLGGGMASLPETVIASNAPAESGWVRAQLRFGLALFNGAVVDQNFNAHAGRLERMTDLLRSGPTLDRLEGLPGVERRTIGLGVERDTVLILQENTIRAMGSGRGHIFLKSNGDRTITWQTLSAGEEPLVLRSSSKTLPRMAPQHARVEGHDFNPFGVPDPINPLQVGTVVLHGGGSTREITDLLPKLAGVAKPRMVHCPSARESCRPVDGSDAQQFAAYLEDTFSNWRELQTDGRLAELTFVTTNKPADANRASFVQPLQQANALWFCGGDQAPLAQLYVDPMRPTMFQEAIYDILRRGGVVGGSSAGLAVMSDVMIEGGEPENGHPAEAKLSRGIGTMKHVLAEQHFDARSGRIERLTGLLRDHKRLANFAPTCKPKQMIGLAVEEDTALIAQGNRLRVTGKKFAHVFLQSTDPRTVTWHALHPGDAAILRPGHDGYVLQLEDWEFQE